MHPFNISRRSFLQYSGVAALGTLVGCNQAADMPQTADAYVDLASFIDTLLREGDVAGFSAALVRGDQLLWSQGFGFADIGKGIPMTPDTIQNIGSISKTFTATAVMQLWEEGAFDLDDDVNAFLPFSVRNPGFPDTPITFRQLLAHRSSITDSDYYDASYACGDPAVSLEDWITGYFTPDGPYYTEDNFLAWEPGTVDPLTPPRAYSNVGYGLLGLLVEKIAATPFDAYCKARIFDPLKMTSTGWFLRDVDAADHATVYAHLGDDFEMPDDFSHETYLIQDDFPLEQAVPGANVPHCPYSFYNYPDGLVRTSVNELSRYIRAYSNGGVFEGAQILKPETIDLMLANQHFDRGLCWESFIRDNGDVFWSHDGGDPGIATSTSFRREDGFGYMMFYNTDSPVGFREIRNRLFEASAV